MNARHHLHVLSGQIIYNLEGPKGPSCKVNLSLQGKLDY